MIGDMEVTDDDMMDAARKAVSRVERSLGGGVWGGLGVTRDDALQEAAVAAYRCLANDNGSTPVAFWMYRKAKFGLMDYVRELRADQKKRSPARVVLAGLDDVEIEWISAEEYLDDEDCGIQPEAKQEIPGAEIEAQESRVHARTVIDAALLGALEGRERRVVRLAFGLDGVEMTQVEIAAELGISRRSVQMAYKSGMAKLRAEMQVNEIMGL